MEAPCSLEEVAWLWGRASHRGRRSFGTRPGHRNPGGELAPADIMMHDWISGMQFKEVVSCGFARQRRINLLELQSHKTWAVRASKTPACWRARSARRLDSGVVIGALGRGRSSSHELNGL